MEKLYPYLEKIPERFRLLLVAGVSVLLFALYLFFIRFPAQDDLKKLRGRYDGVHKEYLEKKAIADDLQNWRLQVQRLKILLNEALTRLPNQVWVEDFLVQVPNIAKKDGLIAREFSLDKERMKEGYAEVPIRLKLSGNFFSFGLFAQEIAEQPRIMTVRSFKLTPDSGKGGGGGGGAKGVEAQEAVTGEVGAGIPLAVEAEVLTYRFVEAGSPASQGPKAPGGQATPTGSR
jgi:type IV pilus assembly protein PilO